MKNITLIVEDKFLPNSEVTHKDFLDLYNLEQWQLDKMIIHGMKTGAFKFKGFIYQLYLDGEKVEPKIDDTIILPEVTRNGRKTKFLIDNVVISDNLPPKNTYKSIYCIFGEEMVREDFKKRVGISHSYLTKHANNAESFTLNGVLVKVIRETIEHTKYKVINKIKDTVHKNQTPSKVIARTHCKTLLLDQIKKFGFACQYKHFVISLDDVG